MQLTLLVAFAAASGVYFLVEPHVNWLTVSLNPRWSSHTCGRPLTLAVALSAAVRPFIPPGVSPALLSSPIQQHACTQPHRHVWLVQVSVLTTLSWMVTAHWILHDVLGVALCVAYVSHLRLPNLKVSMRSPKHRRSAGRSRAASHTTARAMTAPTVGVHPPRCARCCSRACMCTTSSGCSSRRTSLASQ